MFANMPAIYHGLVAISRFEQGPDTLPYSTSLVTSVLTAYALVKIGIAFLTMRPGVAFISRLVDTLLSVTIVAAALTFRRFPNRIIQTLTAFAGVGTAINLVAFLGMSFVNLSPHHLLETYVTRVFTFPLMVWNLAINAHILRRALSTRFLQGLGLALLIAVASWLLTTAIHPATRPTTLHGLREEARPDLPHRVSSTESSHGSRLKGYVCTHGERLIEGTLEFERKITRADLPKPMGLPLFHIRHFPSVVRGAPPSVLELVRLGADDIRFSEAIWAGKGTLMFFPSDIEERMTLAPKEIIGAYHFSSGYSFPGGEVLHKWV